MVVRPIDWDLVAEIMAENSTEIVGSLASAQKLEAAIDNLGHKAKVLEIVNGLTVQFAVRKGMLKRLPAGYVEAVKRMEACR